MINLKFSMSLDLWKGIKYFTPSEFGCEDMNGILIYTLENLRKYVGRKVVVHCGYEERETNGYHPKKCAVDIHIEGLNVVDQFLVASRFDAFNGIGVYPYWNSPGLHLDTRPIATKFLSDSRWGCNKAGEYVKLDSEFFRGINYGL